MDLIAEGAEAKIYKLDNGILKKIRLPKAYRLEIIDLKLRKFRNKREFKILTKLYENRVNVPKPFEISDKKTDIYFTFEYLKGEVLKDVLTKETLFLAFEEIIKMHNLNVVHGDLTTLNMIKVDNLIYIIDFGLGQFSSKYEDKAVDLNLFFTCIKNEHPDLFKYKNELIENYLNKVKDNISIIDKLSKLEKRGRNK